MQFIVKVENKIQLNVVLDSDIVSEIILARDSFAENELEKLIDKIKSKGKKAWILMERISRYEEKMISAGMNNNQKVNVKQNDVNDLRLSTDKIYKIKNLDGIIIQNLDSFAYMLRRISNAANEQLKVEINYTMNCYNLETKKLFESQYQSKRKNADAVPLLFTAPVELNIYELSDVTYDTMILYSYIDTMVTANCLYKNTANEKGENKNTKVVDARKNADVAICKHRFNFNNVQDFSSYIIDRKGKKLHYKTYCKYCYNKIFNTEPIYLLDKIDEIREKVRGNKEYIFRNRIDFSFESEKEIRNILSMKCPETFTRGHYKNSIK